MKKCEKLAAAKLNGFVHYITGRPCSKGHICERLVSDRSCVKCNRTKAQNKRDSMTADEKYAHGLKYRHIQKKWLKTEVGCISRQKTGQKYYQNNQDKLAEYRKEYNLKTNNFHSKRWKKENPEKRHADVAKRRASKLMRTPVWLDATQKAEIDFTYEYCAALRSIGMDYHVDHIVPLQGRTVSGLHVPFNLQVIHAKDNLRKANNLRK